MSLKTLPLRLKATTLTRVPTLSHTAGATPRTRGRKGMERRAAWLRLHPLCCDCEDEGRTTAADEVDHDIPLWKGGADDESNFKSRCVPHHKVKTAREAAERGFGAPGPA